MRSTITSASTISLLEDKRKGILDTNCIIRPRDKNSPCSCSSKYAAPVGISSGESFKSRISEQCSGGQHCVHGITSDLATFGVRLLLPNRLAFVSGTIPQLAALEKMRAQHNMTLFTSELHHKYEPYAADFGPVNLGIVYRFCLSLAHKMASKDGLLVYCFDTTFESQANASFLLGAFLLLRHGWTPTQASSPFTSATAPFTLRPFRDADDTAHFYPLSLLDCLRGLHRAVKLGWFDMATFDYNAYTALESPAAGDLHRLCPKLVAFKGPVSDPRPLAPGERAFPPVHYVAALRRLGVTCVVRLNDPATYDPADFTRAGIQHLDLPFDDCTPPPPAVAERFLDLCDRQPGAVAVHCRAGLGRTGTLAALWMMRRAGFRADEAIGWIRAVRPGSIIGAQQQYLKACDDSDFKLPRHGDRPGLPVSVPPPRREEGTAGGVALSELEGKLLSAAAVERPAIAALAAANTGGLPSCVVAPR